MKYRVKPTQARFWSKVDIRGDDECWEWQGAVDKDRYGHFRGDDSVQTSPHRYSYVIHFGNIPDGLEVCHKCDNKICVNPKHLFLGTHLDNEKDKVSKGRQAKGVTNGQSGEKCWDNILTTNDVIQIRTMNQERPSTLAKLFKVSPQTICDIRAGRSWKWL